ncbi:MAG: SMP-30/gluconolactonase/LRE family protein [Sphingomonas sp.]|uniref:SMP-30/gluconolactonase/LRE family protein n=1 Tax=Sphingomonas sp. TaxID=28214 RepID=UPI0022767BBA|nr:SMP-30/gluconolactonase/LRE family protein [Sphingomonas sp.]MCX8476314.1 SMP-30/gluconolactonase/LRE family protein [Sphingomonas sp.]
MSESRTGSVIFSKRVGRLAGAALIALAAAQGTAFAQSAPAAQPEAKAPVLDRAQVDALLATPDKVTFIDVRRADEIAASGTVPVYLNIQVSELDRFLPYIPRDRQIVTISNHAGRAGRAASVLRDGGFNVVGAVGIEDYAAKGGTLYGKKFVTPAIAGVVAADTRVQVVREGFEGTEGPVALPDGSLLFTENRADRIVRIAPNGAASTYLEKTGGANALALNAKGELFAVQTAPSAIAVLQPTPKVLAAKYEGKPLNRPNDFALARAGDIYFSDPGANPGNGAQAPATPAKSGFYWLDRRGKLHLAADDIRRPNGVALSADEKTVYVANTAGEYLIAFTVKPDGSLAERRDFARLAGFKQEATTASSGADGIVSDEAGRVYVATNAGIEIFSPQGEALGTIALPKKPQNLAFAGKDRTQLYAVGRGSVFRIATLTHGVDRPGK